MAQVRAATFGGSEDPRPRVVCTRCGQVVPYLLDGDATNLDLGLRMLFSGGYGEFVDTFDGDLVFVLCHSCAHALTGFLGVDDSGFHTGH